MHRNLGNRDAQRQIRIATPNAAHCQLLEVNPKACNLCPLNPHLRRSRLTRSGRGPVVVPPEEMENLQAIILDALEMSELVSAGVTFPAESVSYLTARATAITKRAVEHYRESQSHEPASQNLPDFMRHPGAPPRLLKGDTN